MTDQGEVYADFVAIELEQERHRRDRLDAKSNATLVTSAGLVSLVAALGILDPVSLQQQPLIVRWGFVVAAASLMISAVLGLLAGWLHVYTVLSERAVRRRMLNECWGESQVTARSRVAQFNAETLDTLRQGNNTKARQLLWAHALQVLGGSGLVAVALAGTIRSVL
jgi:hypothetical protein